MGTEHTTSEPKGLEAAGPSFAQVAEGAPLILAVDDEAPLLRHLELTLARRGFRVVTAATGTDAVRQARDHRPDVILLDVMLPDIEGYEACRQIKALPEGKHIPILLLTALNDVFSKVKGLEAGADDFISKPFNESELAARLLAFLRTKRLHDELEASYRRLKELEDLKNSLTHMILHDLMSPLTAIQVGVESVLERLTAGEAPAPVHQRLLKNAHEACQKLMDMFRDILSVNRLEENRLPLQRVWIEATDLVREALSTFDNERRLAGIRMDVRMDAGLPRLYCDRDVCIRVLSNLIANSLKFTSPGGRISITVRRREHEGGVEISIEDTGVGIAPEDLEKVFDKFYQVHRSGGERKGFGLGLAFCKLAVEAHGGRIWAESRVGEGSRFIFLLPAE